MEIPSFTGIRLHVCQTEGIGVLELARRDKSNAFNEGMWADFTQAMQWLDECDDVSVVIIRGQGRNFCGGIDLEILGGVASLMQIEDSGRGSAKFRHKILKMQESFNAIEKCRRPVIASIQGACVGGGLDLIAACDIRICSSDATFCLKEVDLALAADLGSLQRLPKIIGHGRTSLLALTGTTISASEAHSFGLVGEVCSSQAELHSRTRKLAAEIARKSPMAVTGIKRVLLHARDHNILDGLEYVATWNGGQALSHDIKEAFRALQARENPAFSKL